MSNGKVTWGEPKLCYAPVGTTDFVELGQPVIADFTCEEPSKGNFSPSESTSLTLEYNLSPEQAKSLRRLFKALRLPRKKKKAYKKLLTVFYPPKSKLDTIYGNYKLR